MIIEKLTLLFNVNCVKTEMFNYLECDPNWFGWIGEGPEKWI